MSDSDKRIARRRRSQYVVEFYNTDGLFAGVGRVLDLSATGALIESALRLTPGDRYLIRLRRGEGSQLNLPITVVRVRGKGTTLTYGVRFTRERPLFKLF